MRVIDITIEDLRAVVREVIREEVAALTRTATIEHKEYLSTAEAARIAGRHPDTIRAWIRSGRLRTLPRQGREHARIDPQDLEAALKRPERPEREPVDADQWAQGILRRVV